MPPSSHSFPSPGPACNLRDPVLAGALSAECKVGRLWQPAALLSPGHDVESTIDCPVPLGSFLQPPALTVHPQYTLLWSHSISCPRTHFAASAWTFLLKHRTWQVDLPILFLPPQAKWGYSLICKPMAHHCCAHLTEIAFPEDKGPV